METNVHLALRCVKVHGWGDNEWKMLRVTKDKFGEGEDCSLVLDSEHPHLIFLHVIGFRH